jgi:hypothetical protein
LAGGGGWALAVLLISNLNNILKLKDPFQIINDPYSHASKSIYLKL